MNNIRIRRIATVFLVLFTLCFSLHANASGGHVSVTGDDGGRILNCFGWRYTTIKNMLARISAANYSAVQVSSVQPLPSAADFDGKFRFTDQYGLPIPDWYRIYAPTALRMITTDDAEGTTPLGSRADFDALVTAAHNAGIAVVVGVEANQLFKGSATTAGVTVTAYSKSKTPDFNDPTRKSFTNYALNEAVEDINYEGTTNANVDKVVSFVNDLYSAGVDGICWYHAKYIPLLYGQGYYGSASGSSENTNGYNMKPNMDYIIKNASKESDLYYEGSDFWPSIAKAMKQDANGTARSVVMFSYGNLNLDPNFKGERMRNNSNTGYTIDHDPAYFANTIKDDGSWHRTLREYTKYIRVADAWYAKSAIMQDGVSYAGGYWVDQQSDFKYHKNFQNSEITGAYAAEPTDMVYLAENEDTYLGNPEVMFEPLVASNSYHENRPTDQISAAAADRTYADMAAHNGNTIVYFARPYSRSGKFQLGEDVGDIANTPYAYFEDTNNWAGGDKTKVKFNVSGDGVTASDNDVITFVGKHNNNSVYLWSFKGTGTPESISITAGNSTTPTYKFENGATYNATTQVVALKTLPDISKDKELSQDELTVYIRDNIGNGDHDIYVYATKSGAGAFDGESWPGYKADNAVKDANGDTWYYVRVPKNIWERVLYNDELIISAYAKGATSFDKGTTKVGQTSKIGTVVSDQWYILSDDAAGDDAIQYRDVKHVSLPAVAGEPFRFEGKAIAEVNKFHKLFSGESEYKDAAYNPDGTRIDVASICRQHGAILVIRDPEGHPGSHNVANANHHLESNGSSQNYIDQVTGNTFSATYDKINGEIGETGIAVIYNKDEMENQAYSVSPVSGRANENIKVTISNKMKAAGYEVQYQVANNKEFTSENRRRVSGVDITKHAGDDFYFTNKTTDWTSLDGNSKSITLNSSDFTSYGGVYYGYVYRTGWGWGGRYTFQKITPYSVTLYLNVRYRKSSTDAWTTVSAPYEYNIYTGSGTGTLYCNQLYFSLPEGVEPDSISIYAWNDEGGQLFPLVKKGGDRLQKYYSTKEEQQKHWYAPVNNIYEYDTSSGSGYWWDQSTTTTINDDQFVTMVGTNDPSKLKDGFYDYEAESHNDAMPIGHGRYVCRYTIGLPNLHFDNIKVRLSYNHPQGYTEQLETIELTSGQDQFYSISQDDEGRLSIGHDVEMLGDALYDNSTWGYYFVKNGNEKTSDDQPTQNWKSGFWGGFNDSDPTRLSYEPNESNELSVNGTKAEVYTWTGQMIQGKTLRFGERPDFATSFMPDKAKNDTCSAFKRYFKAVPTTYTYKVRSGDYVPGTNIQDTWYMQRGLWFDKDQVPDPDESTDNNDVTMNDLVWTWPSGYYNVKFYYIVNAQDSTFYMTVSQPSLTYEDGGTSTSYVANNTSSSNKTVNFDKILIGQNTGNSYFYKDLQHVGRAGYQGSVVTIKSNIEGEPAKFVVKPYTLDGKDEKNGTSVSSDYSSLYPETGAYRIAYSMGHGNTPVIPTKRSGATTDNSSTITYSQTQDDSKDSQPVPHYLLGFNTMKYNAEQMNKFKTVDEWKEQKSWTEPTSYWASYSDGLPRVKPAGVKAYYVSGYVLGDLRSTQPLKALYLTEFKGDVLPANTGLMLCFTPSSVTNLHLGEESEGAYVPVRNLYLEAADPETDYIAHQAGTNFLQPWIAYDDKARTSSETVWKQMPNVKRPSSKYLNYIFSYGYWNMVHVDEQTGEVTRYRQYGVSFFPVPNKMSGSNYEWRRSFVSIPKSGSDDDDPGNQNQTFTAKSNAFTRASDDGKVVITAPVDIVWGDDGGALTTGIYNVNNDSNIETNNQRTYNLQGQEVTNPHHGVFIRGGRKIIKK